MVKSAFPVPKLKMALWALSLILFSACSPQLHKSSSSDLLTVDAQTASDPEFMEIISPYREKLEAEMNSVIAVSEKELSKKGRGETTLGNFVADLQKEYAEEKFERKIDISVVNNGGLRNSLPEGNITVGNIFELSPFENFIYVLELKGSDVQRLAEYAVKGKNLGISGMFIESEDDELKQFTVNGNKIDPKGTYLLAINDYLANGGDRMEFLIELPRLEASNILLRDMLLIKIREITAAGKKVDAEIEGRQKLN